MSLVRIDHHPSRRQLMVFGFLWIVFFAIAGKVVLSKTECMSAALAIWGVAVGVPLIGSVLPGFMRFVYVAMAYATLPIGLVISLVILAIIYYLAVTPIGLVMRLLRYDPMHRRFDPNANTYWFRRQDAGGTERYFRQF